MIFAKQSTLVSIERLRNSAMGNPQFKLSFANGLSGKTVANSMEAYQITDRLIGESLAFEYRLTNSGREYIQNIGPAA